MEEVITLACGVCKRRNYTTLKNKKNDPDRIELTKYCRWCHKNTPHKETKKPRHGRNHTEARRAEGPGRHRPVPARRLRRAAQGGLADPWRAVPLHPGRDLHGGGARRLHRRRRLPPRRGCAANDLQQRGDALMAVERTQPTPDDEAQWYVIHAYSGHEEKVKKNLEKRIESMDMQDKILQVLVPMEDEIEIKDGKRRHVQKRIFPGYILVKMKMSNESWFVVR